MPWRLDRFFFSFRVTVSVSWGLDLRVGNLGSGTDMEVDRGYELIQAGEIAGFAVLGVVRWQASPTTNRDSMQYYLFTACLFPTFGHRAWKTALRIESYKDSRGRTPGMSWQLGSRPSLAMLTRALLQGKPGSVKEALCR